jgi:hypothetical protein
MRDLVGAALATALPDLPEPDDDEGPPWAAIGEVSGLASALTAAGLDDVEVHTVTRHFRSDDPIEFFRQLPAWSPSVAPLFEAVPTEAIETGARAFAELVAAQDDDGRGVPVDALLGVGRRP